MGNIEEYYKKRYVDCVANFDKLFDDIVQMNSILRHEFDEQKKYYYIWCDGVGSATGYIPLTEQEAQIIDFVCDKSNWLHLKEKPWSPTLGIDIEYPLTEEEFKERYKDG